MTNEITTPKASALAVMASRFSVDPAKLLETLKNTAFKGASNDEMMALVIVSNEYGLNPLTKEIYAFQAKGGGIVPVVSIDGWLNIMNNHPQFDGIDYEWLHEGEKLIACTSIIHRKDRAHPTRVTEYLSECRRSTDPWKMEHRMLRHKATIQGARVAFGFSGITDEDEARDTPPMRDVTPSAGESSLFKSQRTTAKNGASPTPIVGQSAEVFNEAPSLIPVNDVTALDAVKAWLKSSKTEWTQINQALLDNGVLDDVRHNPDDATDDELRQVIGMRSQLEAMKGGVK
jgi:phage recombination protein Bet